MLIYQITLTQTWLITAERGLLHWDQKTESPTSGLNSSCVTLDMSFLSAFRSKCFDKNYFLRASKLVAIFNFASFQQSGRFKKEIGRCVLNQ